jgi:Fe-S-cluster containining protein
LRSRCPPLREPRAASADLLNALRALYARADALYLGARCEGSTACCRFGITGREPQVTSLEFALVEQAVAARGGPLRPQKRALPLAHGPVQARGAARAHVHDERTCPLLDRAGKCSIYAQRPLGCRTFYCERADVPAPPSRQELRALVRELEELAAQYRPGGDKPRALTSALSRASG